MLFAWTERKTFTFYDDKECSLNVAYKLMQAGDFAGAAREAETKRRLMPERRQTGSPRPCLLQQRYGALSQPRLRHGHHALPPGRTPRTEQDLFRRHDAVLV
jgi:hypothetical protein